MRHLVSGWNSIGRSTSDRNDLATRLSTDYAAARRKWDFLLSEPQEARPEFVSEADAERSEQDKLRSVEAVLFVARDSLSSRRLAQLAGLADATEARTLVRLLNQRYDGNGRVVRVEEVAGGFCLLTRPQFAPWLRRMRHVPGEIRLTQSAMETLAIVAYRQPVPRADIEAIRGVSCGEILKQLMQRDLVRICGRSEDLGRPYLYGTTRFFLQMFGLRSADRLPRSDWVNGTRHISQAGGVIAGSVLTSVVTSESSGEQDSGTGTDAKESTVRKSFSASTLLQQSPSDADEMLLNVHDLRAVDDDDDDFYDDEDDDEEDDDDFEDDDDLEEDDDFEDEEGEEDLEEEGFEDEEEGDWEEVDDDDEEGEEGEEEEDDWDDEEDDDWDDDDDDADSDDDDEDWD